jgi:hypothetical protein
MCQTLQLQVQPLRLPLTLCLQHSLPRRPKIRHLHPHSPLSKSHQTRLRANSLDIRTTKIILLVDELVEVDVAIQGHFGRVEGEDLLLC